MQAILIADYSFTPLEYWRSVSLSAREFIKRCLTIDPKMRLTAHEALSHPFVDMEKRAEVERERGLAGGGGTGGTAGMGGGAGGGGDLLPVIKKNFNARRTLHAAIDTIRAINKLREGGAAGLMEGAMSGQPARQQEGEGNGAGNGAGGARRTGADAGETMDGVEHTGSSLKPPPPTKPFDPRGNARGQTEEMIRAQQKRVEETARGLWSSGAKALGR